MAVDKCVKCGADIPKGATFCPACGAPKAADKPASPPQPVAPAPAPAPQPVQKAPSSIPDMMNSIFTETNIYVMMFLGILLAAIGGIILLFTFGTVAQIGGVLNSLGFVFISVFLLFGGLVNKSYDKYIRVGMIISGALSLTWTLSWVA